MQNEFRQLRFQDRVWRFVRQLCESEQVMTDVLREPSIMKFKPGVLNREHIDIPSENVMGEVRLIARFSPANASNQSTELYERYRDRYSQQDASLKNPKRTPCCPELDLFLTHQTLLSPK
jgi:hypothetical protein